MTEPRCLQVTAKIRASILLAAAPIQGWHTTGLAGVAARLLGTPPLPNTDRTGGEDTPKSE